MRGNHVGVIGAGAWGTALALAFARAGRDVTLWGRDGARIAAMARDGLAGPALPGVALEARIHPVADLAQAALPPVLVLAVPTEALRQVCDALALVLAPGRAVICAAKGIERQTGRFVTEVMADCLGTQRFGVLSGPSFAADVAAGKPTAVVLAMGEAADAAVLARDLTSPALRLYHSSDIRGVEIGGAAKNVLAIAAGIVAGMDLGESARAAIIARGFAELRRFAEGFGAKPETLMGLSGLGDLVLTASSAASRNFALGHALGRSVRVREALGGRLAEGAFTAPVLVALAEARGIAMPIAEAVASVLAEALSIADAAAALMARPLRGE